MSFSIIIYIWAGTGRLKHLYWMQSVHYFLEDSLDIRFVFQEIQKELIQVCAPSRIFIHHWLPPLSPALSSKDNLLNLPTYCDTLVYNLVLSCIKIIQEINFIITLSRTCRQLIGHHQLPCSQNANSRVADW